MLLTSRNSLNEAPISASPVSMIYTIMSEIIGGMGGFMAHHLRNISMPHGKAVWWVTDQNVLEIDTVDSNTVVERYALAVIFYAPGGYTWIYKSRFLSNMSVCHCNYYDKYDVSHLTESNEILNYVGTNFTEGIYRFKTLKLSKFLVKEIFDGAVSTSQESLYLN